MKTRNQKLETRNYDLSDIILTDKTSESQENEKVESRKEENENYENEYEDEYENQNEDYEYENENEDYENKNEDVTMSQKVIKNLNDNLDETIAKSKSFEDQIGSLKKLEGLKECFPYKDFGEKELKSESFKIQLADMSNEIDKKLFEQIFGHTLIKLADKLINTTNKEKNQIIVNNINKNKDKLYKRDEFNDFFIQPQQCADLKYTVNLILNFNKKLNQLWLDLPLKNIKMSGNF